MNSRKRARRDAGFEFETVLLDVDGTLIDSNAAHAEAWTQALREHEVTVDIGQIRPLIGMGADKLLPAVASVSEDSTLGQSMGRRKKAIFERFCRASSRRQAPGCCLNIYSSKALSSSSQRPLVTVKWMRCFNARASPISFLSERRKTTRRSPSRIQTSCTRPSPAPALVPKPRS